MTSYRTRRGPGSPDVSRLFPAAGASEIPLLREIAHQIGGTEDDLASRLQTAQRLLRDAFQSVDNTHCGLRLDVA